MANSNPRTPAGYAGMKGTQNKQGIVRFAKSAEVLAGSLKDVAVSPSTLAEKLAAPGAIGSTTPAAATFTSAQINDILSIDGGAATDFIGQATLAAGTVTVLNTNIAATDKILVSRHGINGSTALGVFDVAITPATSFTITSLKVADATTETNDTSIVDYVIIRQA